MPEWSSMLDVGDPRYNKFRESAGIEAPDYSQGIPVAKQVDGSGIVRIPLTPKTRVGIYAKSGEKKTILGKRFVGYAIEAGAKVFCGNDAKNDFQSADYTGGASKSLQDATAGFLPGEQPHSIKRTLGVPLFLSQHYESRPHGYATVFSLDFSDIQEEELTFLLDIEGIRSRKQQNILTNIIIDNGTENLSWNKLEAELPDNQSGESIKTHIKPIKQQKILSAESNSVQSFIDFEESPLISLGLKGWSRYHPSDMEKIRFYSAVCHRKVLELAEQMPNPVVVFDDEFHFVAPKSESSRVKHAFQNFLDIQGRQAGIITVQSTQRPDKIPDGDGQEGFDFLGPLTHAFLGRGMQWEQYKRVFSVFDVWNPNRPAPLRRVKKQLRSGQFMFLHEDMQHPEDIMIVEPLCPPMAHPEGDK